MTNRNEPQDGFSYADEAAYFDAMESMMEHDYDDADDRDYDNDLYGAEMDDLNQGRWDE